MYGLSQALLGIFAFVCLLFGVVGSRDDTASGVGAFLIILGIVLIIILFRRKKKHTESVKAAKKAAVAKYIADNLKMSVSIEKSDAGQDKEPTQHVNEAVIRTDPDEDAPPPPGTNLSYLDAKALRFWNGRHTDYVIPDYYQDTPFGRNVGPALDRLLEEGYIDFAGIEKNISLKKVPELKKVLADKGLKVSGNKSELIKRIIENIDPHELESLFPVGVYVMTPKGEKALEPYSIVEKNERQALRIPYYRLMDERAKHPEDSDDDVLLRILHEDVESSLQDDDQSAYQNAVLKLAGFLIGMGKPEQAFEYSSLGFFMWAMMARKIGLGNYAQDYYQAQLIDSCGKQCNYSLQEVIDKMKAAITKANPFGLATGYNVKYTIKLFEECIGLKK